MGYTRIFKKKAVQLLSNLNQNGFAFFKGNRIENVRDLVDVLGCSSASLYAWDKKFSELDLVGYDESYNHQDHEYPSELFQNKEKQQEVKRDALKEMFKEDTSFEEWNPNVQISEGEDKDDIFGLRFYGWMAKAKGIKGYSRMKLDQLKYELGKELIKEVFPSFPFRFPKL
jgi:hypothetical protein